MKDNDLNTNFLAKWLNEDISDEKLESLVSKEDFETYNKIKNGLEYFEAPKFDANVILSNIENKIETPKVIKLIPNWVYSAAASVALLITAYIFVFSSTTISTGYGQQTAINLLDGSSVKLNVKSSINYNKWQWHKNRKVNLKGEAYFEVSKGSTFTVKTKMGNIQVLGTHFNVKADTEYLLVTCYEGKVRVTHNNKSILLTHGQSVQFLKDDLSQLKTLNTIPSWTNKINSYINTPLYVIIKDLENQFGIKIKTNKIDTNILLTASFKHNDIDVALKSIFIPLNLDYKITKEKSVILSEKK